MSLALRWCDLPSSDQGRGGPYRNSVRPSPLCPPSHSKGGYWETSEAETHEISTGTLPLRMFLLIHKSLNFNEFLIICTSSNSIFLSFLCQQFLRIFLNFHKQYWPVPGLNLAQMEVDNNIKMPKQWNVLQPAVLLQHLDRSVLLCI